MSLQNTRKGYSYQDKYALWKLLNSLNNKEVSSFFIDEDIGDGKALDIKMTLQDDKLIRIDGIKYGELVYEVKTGANYKGRDEFYRALAGIIEYINSAGAGVLGYVVSDETVEVGKMGVWAGFRIVKEKDTMQGSAVAQDGKPVTTESAAKFLLRQLKRVASPSSPIKRYDIGDLKAVVEKIDILVASTYKASPWMDSDIEKAIRVEITNLIAKAECNGDVPIIDEQLIACGLLEVMRHCAENRRDCTKPVLKFLVDVLAVRSFATKINRTALKSNKNMIIANLSSKVGINLQELSTINSEK